MSVLWMIGVWFCFVAGYLACRLVWVHGLTKHVEAIKQQIKAAGDAEAASLAQLRATLDRRAQEIDADRAFGEQAVAQIAEERLQQLKAEEERLRVLAQRLGVDSNL